MRVLRLLGVSALCACAVAACGSSHWVTLPTKHTTPPSLDPHRVDIYVSLPGGGSHMAESEMLLKGIKLAFGSTATPYRVGPYQIKLIPRNGSSLGRAQANAEAAAADPNAVLYFGDMASSATKLSLPILNQAGIMQITPGSPYPGLTTNLPGITQPHEPGVFYPSHPFTLLRLIPDDLVQASAAIEQLKSLDCTHAAAASFGSQVDGPAMVQALKKTAISKYGLSWPVNAAPGTAEKNYPTYVDGLRGAGVNCFVMTGRSTPASIALIKEIHTQMSTMPILGTTALCNDAWLDALRNGDPTIVERLYCTSPYRPLQQYGKAGTEFATQYRQYYGKKAPEPTAFALYGYQAGQLAIVAFQGLGSGRDNRAAVRQALTVGTRPPAALSEYTFKPNGDLASNDYGLWAVKDDKFQFLKTLNPLQVL